MTASLPQQMQRMDQVVAISCPAETEIQVRNQTISALDLTAKAINQGGFARLGLSTANAAVNVGFETAKVSTRFGLGIARLGLGFLGLSTAPIEFAEFLALTGIELGHGITSLSIQGSGEIVRILQQFFGDPFSLELLKSVIDMVSVEVKKTGVEMGMIEMYKYFSAWVSLQKITKEKWKVLAIFPYVDEILRTPTPSSLPSSSKPKSTKSKPIWKSIIKKTFSRKRIALPDVACLPVATKRSRFPEDASELHQLLKHFVKFANGCYGERAISVLKGNGPLKMHSSDYLFYADYVGISVADVKYLSRLETKSDLFNSDYQPRFCLSVDHSHQTVVLAFRGTLSARDVVVDLASESMKLSLGSDSQMYSLHSGMLKVIAKCAAPEHSSGIYRKTLDLLNEYPEYSFTITGHSLGAGLASILGVFWADPKTCRTRPESLLPNRQVQVLAFACPSVMDENLGSKCSNLILSVVIGWDWLARVSHAAVLEIRDAAIKLKEAEQENPELLKSIISGKFSNPERDLETLLELRQSLASQSNLYDRIYPPGRIAWIYKTMATQGGDAFAFYNVEDRTKVFGEILFDDNMMKHHQPDSYDSILDEM